jgi:poly[(R)-3-hydroxyalkanoate] polymerase subunit PhaC
MSPAELPGLDFARAIKQEVARTQLRARKGIELVARRPPPMTSMTPKDEVWSLGKARLWRYRTPEVGRRPPIMLFLGLVGDSAIFDLHPGMSWAERLLNAGFDVYLFDWGRPEAVEADHTLDTYLSGYFVHAVDAVRRIAAADEVGMGAYCMGAFMLLLLLGSRDDVPAGNLVLFTPPCDFEHGPAFIDNYREERLRPSDTIDETTGLVPEGAIRGMFRMLQPTSELVQYVTLWENLWRDEYVQAHRAANHWAWNHRAMAGAAFTEMITQYVRDNARGAGDVVMLQTWEPERALDLIAQYSVDITMGATPFLSDLLDAAPRRSAAQLPKIFICGGAPIPPSLIRRAVHEHDSRVVAVWGMSEYPVGTATATGDDPALASMSDGRPCGRADVVIVDAAGVPVPVGAEGDVIIRGPGLFKGYYKRPDLDADSFTAGSYLKTGDRARLLDDRGHIRICGRTKDIIIRGGENIPVVEIEDILLTHPAIKEVALVALPHERLGETACACLVLRRDASAVGVDDLARFLEERGVAKQFFPEAVRV